MNASKLCELCGARLFASENLFCRPCNVRRQTEARTAREYAKRGLRTLDEAQRRLEEWRRS